MVVLFVIRYHVYFLITLFLSLDQTQLIIWTQHNNLAIVTSCIEASLGRANYSLWTNLVGRKSGISIMILEKSKDQGHVW